MARRTRYGRHPAAQNRKIQYDHDRAIYRQRNVVERMFCCFKDWRRIATRFDRNLKIMGAISLAARYHLVAVVSPDPSFTVAYWLNLNHCGPMARRLQAHRSKRRWS
jgi:hypothetical protein